MHTSNPVRTEPSDRVKSFIRSRGCDVLWLLFKDSLDDFESKKRGGGGRGGVGGWWLVLLN